MESNNIKNNKKEVESEKYRLERLEKDRLKRLEMYESSYDFMHDENGNLKEIVPLNDFNSKK